MHGERILRYLARAALCRRFGRFGVPDLIRAYNPAFSNPPTEGSDPDGTEWWFRLNPGLPSQWAGAAYRKIDSQSAYARDITNTYVASLDGSGRSAFVFRPRVHDNGIGFTSLRYSALVADQKGGSPHVEKTTLLAGSTPSSPTTGKGTYRYIFVDVNGDGLDDAIRVPNWNEHFVGARPSIALNTGNGFGATHAGFSESHDDGYDFDVQQDNDPDTGERTFDYDGDGRGDVLLLGAIGFIGGEPTDLDRTEALAYVSTGEQLRPVARLNVQGMATGIPIAVGLAGRGYPLAQVADVNGDGLGDVVEIPKFDQRSLRLYLRQGIKGDRITAVHDGLGGGARVTYQPYRQATATGKCAYPRRCAIRGMWVVSDIAMLEGETEVAHVTAQYANGALDLEGRGWLGFGQRVMTTRSTGAKETLTFDNETSVATPSGGIQYPFAGHVITERTEVVAGSELLHRDVVTRYQTIGGDPADGRPFAVVVEQVDDSFGNHGPFAAALRHFITTNVYDPSNPYGELQSSTVSGVLSHTLQTTKYEYEENPTDWVIALPHQIQSTSTTPTDSKTRTTVVEHDMTTGLVSAVVQEPTADWTLLLTRRYVRDGQGRLLSIEATDGAGNAREEVAITYDAVDGVFPATTTNALGHVTKTIIHPGFGVVGTVIDPNGVTTTRRYDGFGRPLSSTTPGYETSFETYGKSAIGSYAISGRVLGGSTATVHYDGLGRPIRRDYVGPDGVERTSTTTYDERFLGLPSEITNDALLTDVTSGATHLAYDDAGRLAFEWLQDGSQVRFEYSGLDVTATDARKDPTTTHADELGHVLTTKDAAGSVTTFAYGAFGKLLSVTDPTGNVTSAVYDALGRRTALRDPDAGNSLFSYNAFGELVEKRNGNHSITDVYRDAPGRPLATVNDNDGTTCFSYDKSSHGVGALEHATSPTGVDSRYVYDSFARLHETQTKIDGARFDIDRTYDTFGRLAALDYPAVNGERLEIQATYAVDGTMASVSQATASHPSQSALLWKATRFDHQSFLTGETFGNGVTTARTFDERGFLRAVTSQSGATAIQELTAHYDANGNLDRRIDALTGTTEKFTYDNLDRLGEWTGSGGAWASFDATFQYDAIGNLRERDFASATTSSKTTYDIAGPRPHAVTSSGRADQFAYDGAGNQIQSPTRAVVNYTSYGLPTKIEDYAGNATTFEYDAFGARVKKSGAAGDTIYVEGLYERRGADHVFYVSANGRVVAQVQWTLTADSNQVVHTAKHVFYVHDDAGTSTHTVTDESGKVVDRQRFDPWGRRVDPANPGSAIAAPSSSVNIGYTGQEHDDDLGLINMNGRIYDPELARFLTPDPFVPAPFDLQSYNRYGYALNNPLTLRDPSGFDEEPSNDPPPGWTQHTDPDAPLSYFNAGEDPLSGMLDAAIPWASLSGSGAATAGNAGQPASESKADDAGATSGDSTSSGERIGADDPRLIFSGGSAAWTASGRVGPGDDDLSTKIVKRAFTMFADTATFGGFSNVKRAIDRGSVWAFLPAVAMFMDAGDAGRDLAEAENQEAAGNGDAAETARDRAMVHTVGATISWAAEALAIVGARASQAVTTGASATVSAAADASQTIDASAIRFSQSSVNGVGEVAESMAANGWKGGPIDVVRTPGGLVAIDNTRLLAAHMTGTPVQAVVHGTAEALPASMAGRFGNAATWGEALAYRIGKQNAMYRSLFPNGSWAIGVGR